MARFKENDSVKWWCMEGTPHMWLYGTVARVVKANDVIIYKVIVEGRPRWVAEELLREHK